MDRYEGFDEFVRTRRASLSRTAYLLCGSHTAADDLLQEALAKTAGRWRQVRDGHPEAYVRKVMVNQRTAWWRRRGNRELSVPEVPERQTSGPEEAVANSLTLAVALGTLTAKQRAAIVLRFYEDMTIEQAAETMGLSPGSVKRHTFNALEKMRRVLPSLNETALEVTA